MKLDLDEVETREMLELIKNLDNSHIAKIHGIEYCKYCNRFENKHKKDCPVHLVFFIINKLK